MSKKIPQILVRALAVLAVAEGAAAQDLTTLGTRAAALGAFVAVADDASAVAWNPSGLVSGPFVNLQMGLGRSTEAPPGPFNPSLDASRASSMLIALGTTPVGLSYYRLMTSFAGTDPAAVGSLSRQHNRVLIRTLVTSHVGVTVQQSVGDYLTLGATVKLVRGAAAGAVADAVSWDDALDRASALERAGKTRGDVDLGAMVAAGSMRAGLVVRNLTAPSFGDDGLGTLGLDRQVRVGVAWGDRWPGQSQTIVAVDADLTRVAHGSGDRRDVAAGVERWLGGQRFGVRGGVRASTLGGARAVVSAGGSYAVRPGVFVEGFVARGRRAARAWGVAARVAY